MTVYTRQYPIRIVWLLLAILVSFPPQAFAQDKLSPLKQISRLGTGEWGADIDGVPFFNRPQDIFDDGTVLLVADTYNHCIRRVSKTDGKTKTILGTCGQAGFEGIEDGMIGNTSSVLLDHPVSLALDNVGNSLFVIDSGNRRILQVVGESCQVLLLSLEDNRFNPESIVAIRSDLSGGAYLTDAGNHRVLHLKINYPDEIVEGEFLEAELTVLAGNGLAGYTPDQRDAALSRLNTPTDVLPFYNSSGLAAIYLLDSKNALLRRLLPGEQTPWLISNHAGSDNINTAQLTSGAAQLYQFKRPYRLSAFSSLGKTTLLVSDPPAKRVIGINDFRFVSILLDEQELQGPHGMTVDENGDLWIFDDPGYLIRFRLDP